MKGATHNLRGGQGGDGMKTDNGDYYYNNKLNILFFFFIIIIHYIALML